MSILKKEKLKQKSSVFLGYVLIGGIATVVDMGILFLLTSVAGVYYLISSAISYLFGMITNYSLNKTYNFKNKIKKVMMQFGVFASVALVGLVINQIVLYVLVDFFNMHYLLAKIISVAIVMFYSFIGHDRITFKILR